MADTKISGLTAASGSAGVSPFAAGDLFPFVDISDGTMAATGTDKKATDAQLRSHFGPAWFNVKDYGALGDNSTNDSTAIQAALTAGAGGTVYFPAGTYMASGLTVPADTTVRLDPLAILKKRASATLITIGSRCSLIGGRYDQNGFTNSLILATTAVDVVIERVTTLNILETDFNSSISIISGSQRALVTGCHLQGFVCSDSSDLTFVDNFVVGPGGVLVYNSADTATPIDGANLSNNYMESTAASTIDYLVTIGIFGTATTHAHRIRFCNNEVRCNGTLDGILSIIKTDGAVVTGNVLAVASGATVLDGVELATDNQVVFSGNYVDVNSLVGQCMTFHDNLDCVVSSNQFSNPTVGSTSSGIRVYSDSATGNRRCAISANEFFLQATSAATGILIQSNAAAAINEDIDVSNNVIMGNANASTGSTGIALKIGSGVVQRIHISNNVLRNHRFYLEVGGTLTDIQVDSNKATGLGQLIINPSSGSTTDFRQANNQWQYVTAAPTTDTWYRGNAVWNTTPSSLGPPGWVCVTAGFPGTWKAMANLA